MMFFICCVTYFTIEIVLRKQFYENTVASKPLADLAKILSYSLIGVICALVFEAGYFKVMKRMYLDLNISDLVLLFM